MAAQDEPRRPLIVHPDRGRRYEMGGMRAVFLGDGAETAGRYAIFEWWIDPRTQGPGPHAHPEDHIYYVLAGTLSLVIDGEHTDAPRGSCAVIPGGVRHDFANHGAEPCGFLTINAPGGFEERMPDLVAWFADHPSLSR